MTRVLFQGDSITDCGRNRDNPADLGRGYPAFAAGELGLRFPGKYEFFNRGISGNRIADLYARVKIDTINLKPDVLSVLIGVNDVWHQIIRENGFPADKFERLLDIFYADVTEALPEVKLISLEPYALLGAATEDTEEYPHRWAYYEEEMPKRREAVRRVAEKYGAVYVPLQKPLEEACKLAPVTQWTRDGVHPTPQGHALITKEWLRAYETIR